MQAGRNGGSPADYRLGSVYAIITAALYATQEPFSFLAANRLSVIQFVGLTQVALLVSLPLLLARTTSRSDFVTLFRQPGSYWRLAVIFAVGMTGLLLYNVGLSRAHPIIVSAILNLSPFWAAMVALILARVPIPVSVAVFFSCFAGAFLGAMAVAWSQIGGDGASTLSALAENALHGTWVYAIPVPLCSALGGTLVGKWFSRYDESAAIAANFVTANVLLIPACFLILYWRSELRFEQPLAIALMIAGTITAGSIGRVVYQIALTVTDADNGFVTMFLNLVPALTALISLALSWWIEALHFNFDPMFFVGLALIVAALVIFSLRSWRQPARRA